MAQFTLKKHIEAPPERVFEVVTDLRGAPERIRGITKMEVLTEGPIGVGTRYRETRIMFKREASEVMEITTFDPPRSMATRAESCGCLYHTEFRCTPSGGGTDLELLFDGQPQSFFGKLMGFLFSFMMKSCIKETEKDLDDIKAAVEGHAGPAGEPGVQPA